MKKYITAFLLSMTIPAMTWAALVPMVDEDMSEQTGQALFMLDKVTGNGSNGTNGTGQTGVTFYKMGLDAVVEMNANIKKLQLGCGGVNGQGCDIDIDNMSLSGAENCAGGRPNCNFRLTRPFIQFAIRGDDNPATRQIVGWRFSAERALGLLTTGYQDANTSNAASRNGINTLSGYLRTAPATGNAATATRGMCFTTQQCIDSGASNDPSSLGYSPGLSNTPDSRGFTPGNNAQMRGRIFINARVLGIGINGAYDFASSDYRLTIQSTPMSITIPTQVISGRRMVQPTITGTATLANMTFSGQMNTTAAGIDVQPVVSGEIAGLQAAITLQQSLGLIHKINVNNPFSLSVQGEDILWPGAQVAAQRGWWMAFEDQIDLGNVSPTDQIRVTNDVLLQTLTGSNCTNQPVGSCQWATINNQGTAVNNCQVGNVNCQLYRRLATGPSGDNLFGVRCDGISNCLGNSLPVGTLTVPVFLNVPLVDLKLTAQTVTANCWGTSRFC